MSGDSDIIDYDSADGHSMNWVFLHKRIRPSFIYRRLSSMSVQQPPWSIPEKQAQEPVLRIYNSLTKTKVWAMLFVILTKSSKFFTKTEFVPRNGRHVKWYNCGPTVYDTAHMGHAR